MAHSWRVRRVGAHSKPRRARARLTVSVERPPRVRRWFCHGSFQRIHTTATQVNQPPPPPPPPFDTATTTAHLYAVYPTKPPISKRGEAFLKVSAGLAAGAGSGSRRARAATRRTLSNVHEHTLYTPPTAIDNCYTCPPCLALTNRRPCATARRGVLVSAPDALVAGPAGPEIAGTICPSNSVSMNCEGRSG